MKSSFRRLFSLFAVTMTATSLTGADVPKQAAAWLKGIALPPPLNPPATAAGWKMQRAEIRATLLNLLGDLPPRPPVSQIKVVSREACDGFRLEKFEFDNGAGEVVRGYCFVPNSATEAAKAPAILYCHWHGGQYDHGKEELLQTNAVPMAPGPALAKRGYVVLGIDACGFGERNGAGPDGAQQTKSGGEMTAAKFNLWLGRTLWGMMMRDDLTALDYLASRPEVDAGRIGVTGMSMGSTRAWWVMALDDRPKAAVCAGCMTRYEELIRAGELKAHGIYYFVPGMLKHFDSEAVIALGAPRPMLFMTGDQDRGSPIEGVRKIGAAVHRVYDLHGPDANHQFENAVYPGVGHEYTPEMWERTMAWFDRWL